MDYNGKQIREMGKQIREMLNRRLELTTQRQFLESRVSPLLAAQAEANCHWETQVIQNDGSGAATLEIRLNGVPRVFAKLFYDGSGSAIYEKFRAIRAAGFGAGECYQVVEPIGFIPEHDLLLTTAAEGHAVSQSFASAQSRGIDHAKLLAGVREAARWLAKLHSSPFRFGNPQPLLDSAEPFPLARRLVKTVAQRPDHLGLALEMIQELEKLAATTVDGLQVQCHGQYRPIHVFINGKTVTVIDLDRSRPADPARDIAEFLHRLRHMMFSHHGFVAPADMPTEMFLETYASAVSHRSYLTNLKFHWARYICHSLNRRLKKSDPDSEVMDAHIAFGRSEFENVITGRFEV